MVVHACSLSPERLKPVNLHEFEANPDYVVRTYLKKQTKKRILLIRKSYSAFTGH